MGFRESEMGAVERQFYEESDKTTRPSELITPGLEGEGLSVLEG